MKYANKRNLPFVLIAGENERNDEKVSVKRFATGEQVTVSISEAIDIILKK
jgi:histidyl-tRNA synthetase